MEAERTGGCEHTKKKQEWNERKRQVELKRYKYWRGRIGSELKEVRLTWAGKHVGKGSM